MQPTNETSEDGPIWMTHRVHEIRRRYDTERSWSDPDTHFHLVKSDVTRGGRNSVDGLPDVGANAPTGEVECCECGARAKDVEDICHDLECSQKTVIGDYRFGQVVGFELLDQVETGY